MTESIALPRSTAPRVSVIIPASSTPELLNACLHSLASFGPRSIPYETIVVLNEAGPDAAAQLRETVTGVEVVASPVNLGLAGAGNRGRALAQGEFLVVLHDDAEVEAGWLEALVETANTHPEAGAVGGKVFYPDGRLQNAGMILWRNATSSRPWGDQTPDPDSFDRLRAVDYCGTSSLLVRAEAWDAVGGLDERFYPVYYVDVDLGMALRRLGRVVLYQPASRIRHHQGASGTLRFRWFVTNRNQRLFLDKWGAALEMHEPGPDEDDPAARERAMARAELFAERCRAAIPAIEAPQARAAFDPVEHEIHHLEKSSELQRAYIAQVTDLLDAAEADTARWWKQASTRERDLAELHAAHLALEAHAASLTGLLETEEADRLRRERDLPSSVPSTRRSRLMPPALMSISRRRKRTVSAGVTSLRPASESSPISGHATHGCSLSSAPGPESVAREKATFAHTLIRSSARALVVGVVLYVFVCTFPSEYQALKPGLDASWMFALNYLAGSSTYLYGRDFVFTYGPLGFLLSPRVVGSGATLLVSEALWCLLQVSLFATVAWRLRRHAPTLLLFCGAYLTLIALGLWQEYRFLFAVCAFALLSLQRSRGAWFFAATAALLASAGLLIKWGLGLAAISVVAGSWLLLIRDSGRERRGTILSGVIAVAISVLVFGLAFFRSPANLWKWIRLSTEISGGYSSAMSLDGSGVPLLLAAGSAACLICLHFQLSPSTRRCLWLFLLVVILAFKEGFVRQDGHRMAYFGAAAIIPILLLLAPAVSRPDKWRLTSAFLFLSGATIVYASNYESYPSLRLAEVRLFLLLQPGLQNLQRLASLSRTREELRAATIRNLRPSVVPDSWQKRFDDPQSTVSIFPSELSIAAANRVNWKPAPVLQLYAAYTRALDEATSAGLTAKYLIVNYEAIDGRNPILDTPLTWRAVMEHYAIEDVDLNASRVLLIRKPQEHEATRQVADGRASMNEWVPVPESTHLLYTSLQVERTVAGKLADVFYRIPALYIETVRRSGRAERYRLIPRTAVSGVLMNYLPGNQYEMEELIRGKADDPVVRFRLVQSAHFRHQYAWRLLESTRSVMPSSDPPEPPAAPEIAPATGEGRKAAIEITTSDPHGARDLRLIQLLINRELNGVKACYLSYEVAEDRLWLIADAGSGSAGFGRPGERVALSNSQCTVPLDRVSVRTDGGLVTIRILIEFNASVTGTQHFYLYALDRRGLRTEWQARALWKVD